LKVATDKIANVQMTVSSKSTLIFLEIKIKNTKLQQHIKWKSSSSRLKKKHMILIKEDKFPPFKWKINRRSFWFQYHHKDTTMTGTIESVNEDVSKYEDCDCD